MEYDVKINVIRSNRKSISISVSAQNEIVVRCPRKLSDNRINGFINSKSKWINKVLSENSEKLSLNNEIIEYKEILINGEKLPLIISDKNLITQNAVYTKSIKHIKNLFIKNFLTSFINYAKSVSVQCNLNASGFFVKAYKRRWGCCDVKGNITFNYLLFMLPKQLQRYVIIHELCHTVYFNHSAEFWQLVGKFEPDYKYLRKQLKSYDFITNLY